MVARRNGNLHVASWHCALAAPGWYKLRAGRGCRGTLSPACSWLGQTGDLERGAGERAPGEVGEPGSESLSNGLDTEGRDGILPNEGRDGTLTSGSEGTRKKEGTHQGLRRASLFSLQIPTTSFAHFQPCFLVGMASKVAMTERHQNRTKTSFVTTPLPSLKHFCRELDPTVA